ncbi:hypothetical protein HBI27_245400 [Parastagonospora nodorum]|nr:hypothetical protein HBI27_245400 [Parastagonospora nodorum]
MLQTYYIVSKEYKKLAARLRIIEIKNYAKRNSTVFITRDYTIIKLTRLTNTRRIVRGLENSASASLLIYSDYTLQKCSLLKVTAIYALNYLKLQVLKLTCFLSANMIALISIVLYNAIKEYYNNRIRKIIYFYSYTIENKCRTSYSNKKDIEANEREEETRVQLRKSLEKIHNILLREFYRANNFTENEFAILAEKYIIDNCIIHALALTKDK